MEITAKIDKIRINIEDAVLTLRTVKFGESIELQRKISNLSNDDIGTDASSIETVEYMISWICDIVESVENMTMNGEPIEKLTPDIIRQMPAQFVVEIMRKINNALAGNDASKSD